MVVIGETDVEEPVTVPTLLLIESEVAPVTVQDKVEACPEVTVAGLAEKEEIVGVVGVEIEKDIV